MVRVVLPTPSSEARPLLCTVFLLFSTAIPRSTSSLTSFLLGLLFTLKCVVACSGGVPLHCEASPSLRASEETRNDGDICLPVMSYALGPT